MKEKSRNFPLAAIVGQDALKTAYLANIVDPNIGGLLISGPKGTGKSTVAYGVEGLLPDYEAVDGCPVGCDPARAERLCSICRENGVHVTVTRPMRIVNLPLSCTEDRLIGSIDVETLLKTGRRVVQEGILGLANRNILYVDEVNLLPDHLVDDILDAAASHWNTIEREGVSFQHPTDFVLIGGMNPEEGDLRPQILDRFPLSIRLETIHDPELRVEIVKRNLLFERDPDALRILFENDQARYRQIIVLARRRLAGVAVPEGILFAVAAGCGDLKVDGQRPDIVIVKTARAIAALAQVDEVQPDHALLAAELALSHRTRDGGLLDPPSREEVRGTFRTRLGAAVAGADSRAATGRGEGRIEGMAAGAIDPRIGSMLPDERAEGAGRGQPPKG